MKNKKDLYDFSEYPKTHFYMMKQIKSGLEFIKDETKSYPIQEFIGIRPKMYLTKTYVETEIEENSPEGIKTYVKKELKEKAPQKV